MEFIFNPMHSPKKKNDNLSDEDKLLDCIDPEHGLLRKLMSREEIKLANILVKKGILHKGISDDRNKTVCYYLN